MNLSSIKSLHVVRGLAALIVVIYHAKFVLWSGGQMYINTRGLHTLPDYMVFGVDMLSSCGKQCVIIFFILSAFVIRHSFIANKYSYGIFYKIRLIRIYLPFLFSLLISGIAFYLSVEFINPSIATAGIREYNTRLLAAYENFSPLSFLKALVFVKHEEYFGFNFAYWSLLHEGIFYLLFPLYLGLKIMYRIILFAVLLTAHLLFFHSDMLYYQLFFLIGLFLYDYYSLAKRNAIIRNSWINLIVLLIMYVILNAIAAQKNEYITDLFMVVYSFFIFDFFLLHKINPARPFFKLGNMSYTLYLNHLSVLLIFYACMTLIYKELIFFNRIFYYSGAILAVGVAIIFYKLIEKPSLKLLEKQKRQRVPV